jgi:hypothetical protein
VIAFMVSANGWGGAGIPLVADRVEASPAIVSESEPTARRSGPLRERCGGFLAGQVLTPNDPGAPCASAGSPKDIDSIDQKTIEEPTSFKAWDSLDQPAMSGATPAENQQNIVIKYRVMKL